MRPISIAALVFVSCLSSALMVSAFTGQDRDVIVSHVDEQFGAVCWVTSAGAIDCLPLAQLQAQGKPTGGHRQDFEPAGVSRRDIPSLAGDQPQDGPSPASTPTPRRNQEAFRL